MNGRIAAIVDGGDCGIGVESTVLDMTSSPPCILRYGGISKAELERVSGFVLSVSVNADAGGKPRSPGQKYRHYAPRAPLTVRHISGDKDISGGTPDTARPTSVTVIICPEEYADSFDSPIIIYGRLSEPESLARGLYAALRDADAMNPAAITAICPCGEQYDAVRDRLNRASMGSSAPGASRPIRVVGLTGPSGAGKTRVLEHLKSKGMRVICADEVYRGLLKTCNPMRDQIFERFGTLDTKAIGKTVFSDKTALRELESITHPYVTNAIMLSLNDSDESVIIEAVALYDSELAELCDAVIYLTADREILIERITSRDGISREYAEARLDSRIFYSDSSEDNYCLENNGDLSELYANVDMIYDNIIGR
jgi:L-threonylcarbamoyladenylate synthase